MDIPRPPRWKRWLKRSALAGLAFVVTVVVVCFLVQWRRDAVFAATTPSESFVTIDGHRIYYRLGGNGPFTFVLEAGLGETSANWRAFETHLTATGRVFAYDRAGLGWSEAGPEPRSPQRIADELHAALDAARVPKPWILVGHSWGGYTQMVFAEKYPDGVAGLFLIDPSHPHQNARFQVGPSRWLGRAMLQLPRFAWTGLPQLLFRSYEPVRMTTRHIEAGGAEFRATLQVAETPDLPLPQLGALPLEILTAGVMYGPPGEPPETTQARHETWKALHEELLACSSSPIREHRVIDHAAHFIHQSRPNTVTTAAREFAARIAPLRETITDKSTP
jgi:pimeloyl-ACP methyl ester carboxylesterase